MNRFPTIEPIIHVDEWRQLWSADHNDYFVKLLRKKVTQFYSKGSYEEKLLLVEEIVRLYADTDLPSRNECILLHITRAAYICQEQMRFMKENHGEVFEYGAWMILFDRVYKLIKTFGVKIKDLNFNRLYDEYRRLYEMSAARHQDRSRVA